MAAKTAKTEKTDEITIPALKRGEVNLRIIGTTPLIQNSMSQKMKQYFLVGSHKKTSTEKAEIKHNPLEEFRDSAEVISEGPTAIGLRVVAVKAAMCTAAIETAGLNKTTAQRLLFMPGDFASLYGTPQLRMDVARSADNNKTPDVRTRAFLPMWCAEINIQYIMPKLSTASVVKLLCNAGMLIGVGDYRQEQGKGSFGSFRVIGPGEQDDEWDELVTNHGREAQEAALAEPTYADDETAALMEYFEEEKKRRAA